jgi:hypothetical protein
MPTLISHGSYGIESPCDDVKQIRYGCTDCECNDQGFLEILKVASPPPERKPFLVLGHPVRYLDGEELPWVYELNAAEG